MSRGLRLLGAGLLLAAAVVASGPAVPARAAPVSQCSTTRGTIVAVDFGHWSGPIIRGCGVQRDGGPEPDPYALLAGGGFAITYVNGEPFVCRIGNAAFAGGTAYPTPAEDHCVVTPPASAYWAYWTAAPGATTWHYATMTDKPVPGGVALWTFGATNSSGTQGGPPAGLIDQLRAHNASPAGGTAASRPTGRATAAGASTPGGPGATPDAGRRSTSSVPAGARAAGTTTAPAPSNAGGGGSASPAGSVGPDQPGATHVVSSVAPAQHGSGSAAPAAIAAVLVAAFGTAGGVSLWRRRRSDQG